MHKKRIVIEIKTKYKSDFGVVVMEKIISTAVHAINIYKKGWFAQIVEGEND